MAQFLGVEQLVDLILSELPPDMFASDRADNSDTSKNSISSSSIRSKATLAAAAYTNLQAIYNDKFVSYVADGSLARWEQDYFAGVVNTGLSLSSRRTLLIDQIRTLGGISYAVINAMVGRIVSLAYVLANEVNTDGNPDWSLESGTLEQDTYLVSIDPNSITPLQYSVVTWSGYNGGAWLLESGELEASTYLASMDPIYTAGMDNSLNYAAFGLTQDQLTQIQITAYTYEVRIYGNADAVFLAYLDDRLNRIEPARSTHYIYNNFPGP